MEEVEQGGWREEGVRREQISDNTQQQVRKRLTSTEEPCDGIRSARSTDDGLQRNTQSLPASHDTALMAIKLRKASLGETPIAVGTG